jgi:hypothetical protein
MAVSGVFLFLSALIAGLVLSLAARAAICAREVVRDPQVRVTPQDPWDVFQSVHRRHMRPFWLSVAGLVALFGIPGGAMALGLIGHTTSLFIAVFLLGMTGIFTIFGERSMWIWARWCRKPLSLTLAMTLSGIALPYAIIFVGVFASAFDQDWIVFALPVGVVLFFFFSHPPRPHRRAAWLGLTDE